MTRFRQAVAMLALCAAVGSGCSCEPLVPSPDGGSGGGGGGQMTGGGGGTTGGGGGATGGGGGEMTGGGGGAMTGGGGGGGGLADAGQFTEYVRDLIVGGTNETTAARDAQEFQALPDDAPLGFSQGFFDGGTN